MEVHGEGHDRKNEPLLVAPVSTQKDILQTGPFELTSKAPPNETERKGCLEWHAICCEDKTGCDFLETLPYN